MGYKSDIEIAQENVMLPIREIANKVGLCEDDIEYYGKYKAKVDYNILKEKADKENGKCCNRTSRTIFRTCFWR